MQSSAITRQSANFIPSKNNEPEARRTHFSLQPKSAFIDRETAYGLHGNRALVLPGGLFSQCQIYILKDKQAQPCPNPLIIILCLRRVCDLACHFF
ncbi:hypothetical protein ACOMQZ_002072 [Enterobacter quasiroggenkampii]